VCPILAAAGSGTKAGGKGIDMESVGNINGVPVYEFDLDGLKVEEKPWRKPGVFHVFFYIFISPCLQIITQTKTKRHNTDLYTSFFIVDLLDLLCSTWFLHATAATAVAHLSQCNSV